MPITKMSNFPGGFANGLTVRGVAVLNSYPRNIWWVDSVNGSDGNRGTFSAPYASLAFVLATASGVVGAGDIVVVKAGHTETISGAGTITQSVAGVSVVGLGTGNNRPVITWSATTSTWAMSAANCSVENIVGVPSINAVVKAFNVTAANAYIDIEWQDASTIIEAQRCVLTSAAASNLTVKLRYEGQTGGSGCVAPVQLVGVAEGVIDINFYGKASTAVVNFITTASAGIRITGNMYNSGTTDGSKNVVDTVTGSTWWVSAFDGAAGSMFTGGSAAAPTSATALQEGVAKKAAAVIVNGDTLFTVAGGPIAVIALVSICATNNDGTASTLQYSATPTSGSAQTISGASGSLASAVAGASVTLAGTALATAALLNANGPNLIANPGTIMVPAGTIKAVVGVGSTTGTWVHYIRYRPLAAGVTVA